MVEKNLNWFAISFLLYCDGEVHLRKNGDGSLDTKAKDDKYSSHIALCVSVQNSLQIMLEN